MAGTEGRGESGGHDGAAPPGWYPNPMDPTQARWWDGHDWGPTQREAQDTGLWVASDGNHYPPGGPNGTNTSVLVVPARAVHGTRLYARWWFWALVVTGACGAFLGFWLLLVAAQIGPDAYDLVYEEDFSAGAGKFEVWEEPQGSAAVVDGVYVMTNRNLGKSLTVGLQGPWAADRVRIDARIEFPAAGDRDGRDGFGLYLTRNDGSNYVFAVYPRGVAWITGPGVECQGELPSDGLQGGTMTLNGEFDWSGDEVTTLTGYLNGRVVVTCVDDVFDTNNMGAFQASGLWLYADARPATVEVDDVRVTSHRY